MDTYVYIICNYILKEDTLEHQKKKKEHHAVDFLKKKSDILNMAGVWPQEFKCLSSDFLSISCSLPFFSCGLFYQHTAAMPSGLCHKVPFKLLSTQDDLHIHPLLLWFPGGASLCLFIPGPVTAIGSPMHILTMWCTPKIVCLSYLLSLAKLWPWIQWFTQSENKILLLLSIERCKQFSQSSTEHWFPSNFVKNIKFLPIVIYWQKIIDLCTNFILSWN